MLKLFRNKQNEKKGPPSESKGILSDINFFLLNNPEILTLVKFDSKLEKLDYSQRIMQRLGINVKKYGILNIHQIGIDAPAKYVFEELLRWNGDSTCWPNYIAKVERINNKLENIRIYLFGWTKFPFRHKNRFFGFKFQPLFNLKSIRIKRFPDSADFDNARYLLYKCSGGYPVGFFTMYVRSSIIDLLETNQTQLFFMVAFNFYGHEEWSKISIINKIWEAIHDRVTANTLNRVKQLSEWRFEKIKEELGE